MSEIKTIKRKLRNGPVIEVDEQIIRWRKIMRQREAALGRAEMRAREKNARQNAEYAKPEPTKRKWF